MNTVDLQHILYINHSSIFKKWIVWVFLLISKSSLNILDTSPLSDVGFANVGQETF